MEYEAAVKELEAANRINLERDPNEPAQVFLEWSAKTGTITHKKFLRLHEIRERESSASFALQQTLERLRLDAGNIQLQINRAEIDPQTPKFQVDELTESLKANMEQEKAAKRQRAEQAAANKWAIALYGRVCQFLRDHGIEPLDSSFLLLGRTNTPRPYRDPLREGTRAHT